MGRIVVGIAAVIMNEILAEHMVRERMARFLVFGIRHCGSAPWDGRRSTARGVMACPIQERQNRASHRGCCGLQRVDWQSPKRMPAGRFLLLVNAPEHKRAGALRMTLIVSR